MKNEKQFESVLNIRTHISSHVYPSNKSWNFRKEMEYGCPRANVESIDYLMIKIKIKKYLSLRVCPFITVSNMCLVHCNVINYINRTAEDKK